jgi:hypothetical protein
MVFFEKTHQKTLAPRAELFPKRRRLVSAASAGGAPAEACGSSEKRSMSQAAAFADRASLGAVTFFGSFVQKTTAFCHVS